MGRHKTHAGVIHVQIEDSYNQELWALRNFYIHTFGKEECNKNNIINLFLNYCLSEKSVLEEVIKKTIIKRKTNVNFFLKVKRKSDLEKIKELCMERNFTEASFVKNAIYYCLKDKELAKKITMDFLNKEIEEKKND